ncbi:hypothetical protein UT300005_14020 [Clostridium sp. CTA-5]
MYLNVSMFSTTSNFSAFNLNMRCTRKHLYSYNVDFVDIMMFLFLILNNIKKIVTGQNKIEEISRSDEASNKIHKEVINWVKYNRN